MSARSAPASAGGCCSRQAGTCHRCLRSTNARFEHGSRHVDTKRPQATREDRDVGLLPAVVAEAPLVVGVAEAVVECVDAAFTAQILDQTHQDVRSDAVLRVPPVVSRRPGEAGPAPDGNRPEGHGLVGEIEGVHPKPALLETEQGHGSIDFGVGERGAQAVLVGSRATTPASRKRMSADEVSR